MESEYRKGYVYIQNCFAGIIAETEEGYIFSYDKKYLKREDAVAVSLTLPLREAPYETTILFPFFDGLIPEGWLLGVVSRNWKINQKDRFGLLLAACRDCIGDVCIRGEITWNVYVVEKRSIKMQQNQKKSGSGIKNVW